MTMQMICAAMIAASGLAAGTVHADTRLTVDVGGLVESARTPEAIRAGAGFRIDLGRRGTTLIPERTETHEAVGAETVAGRTAAGGQFIFTRGDGAVHGVVWTAAGAFELEGTETPGGLSNLAVRPVPGDLPECVGPELAPPGAPTPPSDGRNTRSDTTARVLIVFSQGAANRIGNTDVFAANAIASVNTAYINSGVDPLRVELAGAVVLENPISDSSGLQLYGITSLHDGSVDEVRELRELLAADMVAWIVDMAGACGRGYLSPTNPDRVFTVTDPDCAIGNLSFAHELGHNFGAAHDPDNAGGAYLSDAYGHRWSNDTYRSVMAYSPGARVPQFSNPDVSYRGGVTGILNERNNARLHNTSYSIVANHRGGTIISTTDCDGNGKLDVIQIAEDPALDRDFNGALDACQIDADPSLDCDGDGVLDAVQIRPVRQAGLGPFLDVAPGAPAFTSIEVGTDVDSDLSITVGATGDFGVAVEFVELVIGATDPVTLNVDIPLGTDCDTTGISSNAVTVPLSRIAADLPNVPVEIRVSPEVGVFCQYNAISLSATWTEDTGLDLDTDGRLDACAPACKADLTGPALQGVPDSVVDPSDLTFFINRYVARDPIADLTGPALNGIPDDTVDPSDLTYYVAAYVDSFGNCD